MKPVDYTPSNPILEESEKANDSSPLNSKGGLVINQFNLIGQKRPSQEDGKSVHHANSVRKILQQQAANLSPPSNQKLQLSMSDDPSNA